MWCAVWALALALLVPVSAASAQNLAPGAPVQLSEEQVNQIVKAVTGAVLNELKASQPTSGPAVPAPSERPAPAKPTAHAEEGLASLILRQEHLFVEHFETALLAFPDLFAEIGSIVSRLDARPGDSGPLAFLALIAGILIAAAALGYAGAAVASRLLPGASPKGGAAGIGETLRRAAANLAGFGLFWLVLAIASRKLFSGEGMQALVGHWLLSLGMQIALFYTVLLIFFRPAEPAYRIVPLEGRDATLAMRFFLTVLAVVALRSWISIPVSDNQPEPVIAAGLLLNNFLFVASFFLAAWPARGAISRWIGNTAMSSSRSRLRHWLAEQWLSLAGLGVVLLSATHAFGAVSGHTQVSTGLSSTIRTVLVMILLCAFVEFVGRRSERADELARRAIPKLPGLVSQMLRVLIVMGAAIYFVRLWFVDALQAMSQDTWSEIANYAFEPLAALFGTYLLISYVNFLSARYLATHPVSAPVVGDDGEVIAAASDSSRLRTLIPILRITAIIIIVVVMGLLVLSHLGFNITPLLAGASVLGLAISFGSQALVKDIVSGVLFLAEDSFRVGEYIECGKSSGTVEGFTLRSVRLRHQDGQIYTVPFGQLGEITNFSRDWSTVKFNMSLDRDVDLDDVRRVTKQVAAELKTDFKERLLDPLKLRGVKDVTDNAIVVQFKFTSLPIDPGEIERTARSRLLKAFRDEGIALSRHPWLAATAGQPA